METHRFFLRLQESMKCIVFVKRIITAKTLANILQDLQCLEFLKCEFLVGCNSGANMSLGKKNGILNYGEVLVGSAACDKNGNSNSMKNGDTLVLSKGHATELSHGDKNSKASSISWSLENLTVFLLSAIQSNLHLHSLQYPEKKIIMKSS